MHLDFNSNNKAAAEITYDEFLNVDMQIGEIIEVKDFREARKPSFKLKNDFGKGVGIKKLIPRLRLTTQKKNCLEKKC